jgi:hypothetical protein
MVQFSPFELAKSGQKHKLFTDASKLVFAAQFLSRNTRKILAVADDAAVRHLRGASWMAQALKAHCVEVHVVKLPKDVLARIRKAQTRQRQ